MNVLIIEDEKPDILCLQETKAQQGQAEIDLPEYEEIWNSAERKGYSGTAIFTKIRPISVIYDMPGVSDGELTDSFGDALGEGRVITAEFEDYYLVTVYTPNSKRSLERLEYRHKRWDPLFLQHIKDLEKKKPEEDYTGVCIPNRMLLKARGDLPEDMKKQTVMHEINHAVESLCGEDLKETVIDSFATHWLYIIRNNPELIKWLQEE